MPPRSLLDSFPYWPPGPGTQRIGGILGRGLENGIQDIHNGFSVPEYNDTDTPLYLRPAVNRPIVEGKSQGMTQGGRNQNALIALYNQSITPQEGGENGSS